MTAKGLAMLKRFEGFRSIPYRDPAGFWTVVWGHKFEGRPPLRFYSETACEDMLAADVAEAARTVTEAVTVPLSETQCDALTDFVFNLGSTAFEESTLLRLLNAGRYDAVPGQLRRWVHAGGRVLQGLVERRA